MRTDNCCLFRSKKEVINKSAEIKQVIALHKSMWLTCSASWCFSAKRLHRFKGGSAKFKEGKFIAGCLEKPTLTQEVRISWVKRQRNLLKKALSPPYPISYSLPSSLILATVRNRIRCKKNLFYFLPQYILQIIDFESVNYEALPTLWEEIGTSSVIMNSWKSHVPNVYVLQHLWNTSF